MTTKCCSDLCAKRLYKQRKRDELSGKAHQEVKDFIEKPMSVIKEKDFLSVAETCALLGVSRWTVYKAVEERRLVATKIGRRTIISRQGINALFAIANVKDEPQELSKQSEIDWSKTPIEDCYTQSDLMQILNCKEKTIYTWIKKQNVPKVRHGKYVLFPKAFVNPLLPNPKF